LDNKVLILLMHGATMKFCCFPANGCESAIKNNV